MHKAILQISKRTLRDPNKYPSAAQSADSLTSFPHPPTTPAFIFLAAARQARIASRAEPTQAANHQRRARFWLAMAHRSASPPLP